MAMKISVKVRAKLASKKPPVTDDEISQCFANATGCYLIDTREEHKSDPPTHWFIAETDRGRQLKVVFVERDEDMHIRTAYDPNEVELHLYRKLC